jgi:glycosyltransferase involved in cell wall biosynthesis
MNILFLSSAYGKSGAATNQMWTELCEHLAATHSVTILTAAWNVATPAWREENRVQICSIGSWVLPKIKNRHLWEGALWLLLCAKILGMNGGFDLVVCVDTPRFSAILGWIAKWKSTCKVIMWAMDLPLEQVLRRGMHAAKSSKFAAVTLNWLYNRSLLLCDRTVVLGGCMEQVLASKGVGRLHVIGPWADDPNAPMEISSEKARQQNGLPEKFTIAYFGYAGGWHDFDPILEAIPELLNKNPLQFFFAGVGPGIDRVASEKAKNGWEGVQIKGWVPRAELGSLPQCADIHLVSLKASMLGTCVPSKTYGALAYGRPVVFIGPKECQAAQDILEANAGRVVEDADELVDAVEEFLANREKLEICSRNARKAFLEKHCAQAVFKKWDALLAGFT